MMPPGDTMKHSLKIVLIGAASREFARALVHDLVLERQLWESREVSVVMVDVNAPQLEVMRGYAERCASTAGARVSFQATTDRTAALPGADFVLISIAQKRMELWEQDFRIPFAFGVRHSYGENGGPGAAFHALRNFKLVLPICADVERLCPEAWVLNFTNPEARVLTAILTLTRVRAVGLCHGFHSFRKLAQSVMGVPLDGLDVRTAGINHFFTFYRIAEKSSGKDLVPEFIRRVREREAELPPLVAYLWRTFSALGYVSDHHIGEYLGFAPELLGGLWPFGVEHRVVDPEEQGVDVRTVFEAWRRNLDVRSFLARDLASREQEELTGRAPLAPEDIRASGELAVPVMTDIALDRGGWRHAVNVLNDGGYIANLDRDTSVELPARVDAAGVHPDAVGRLPEGFAALIRQQQSVQRLLVQAYQERSRALLLQALLVDPASGGQARQIEAMLDHMLKVQAAYLPELS
jgi:alpha-galactosidase